MEDMELIIKLSKKTVNGIKDNARFASSISNDILRDVIKAIVNGTPLPKGHGRLGDLDALREEVSSWGMNDYEPSDFTDEIDRTPTIITADKEQTE